MCRNDVHRHVGVGHLDRAQDFFRIIDVDVAGDRKAQEAHRFLTMDEQDDTRSSGAPLQLRDPPHSHRVQHSLPEYRLQRRQRKKIHRISATVIVFSSPPKMRASNAPERAKPGCRYRRRAAECRRRLGCMNPPSEMPARNPPICAHQAMPPPAAAVTISLVACSTCIKNHKTDKGQRWDLEEQWQEKDQDHDDNPRERKKPGIAAEHAGDGAQ